MYKTVLRGSPPLVENLPDYQGQAQRLTPTQIINIVLTHLHYSTIIYGL